MFVLARTEESNYSHDYSHVKSPFLTLVNDVKFRSKTFTGGNFY